MSEIKYIDIIDDNVVVPFPTPVDAAPRDQNAGHVFEFHTPAGGATGFLSTRSAHLIAGLPRGTSEHERIGRKIKVLSIDYTATVSAIMEAGQRGNANLVEPDRELALYFVYDRQNNNKPGSNYQDIWNWQTSYGPNMAITDLAGAAQTMKVVGPAWVNRSLDENQRFRIIKKVKIKIPKLWNNDSNFCPNRVSKTIRVHIPVNKVVSWDASLVDPLPGTYDGDVIPQGDIGMYISAPQNHNGTLNSIQKYEFGPQKFRIRFVDI